MGTVTKKDLIDRIADETGQRRTDVKKTLQEFLDQVVAELAKGNRLEFRDFGVFEVRERAARVAQNPKTLERVAVPPKRTIKFKPGRLMREGVETTGPSETVVVETGTERLDPPQVETKPISPAEVRANG
ncbi:MAG: HU family DNA-binding protein [Planctomycetota bacterium]